MVNVNKQKGPAGWLWSSSCGRRSCSQASERGAAVLGIDGLPMFYVQDSDSHKGSPWPEVGVGPFIKTAPEERLVPPGKPGAGTERGGLGFCVGGGICGGCGGGGGGGDRNRMCLLSADW